MHTVSSQQFPSTMIPALGGLFIFLYVCFVIGMSIFMIMLAVRFVRSHERIASALERIAHTPPRSGP